MDLTERFWNASLADVKRGFAYDGETESYFCLICGEQFQKGVIYRDGDTYYEAKRYARVHIAALHSSMFAYLISLDKKLTGLTDLQKNLLHLFYQGYSDAEIVKRLGGGSTSTIRNHRFALREKEKQAKLFLAIMELLEEKMSNKQAFISIPPTARMVDERFAITEEENDAILRAYFPEGPEGPLKEFPKKEKRKVAILRHILRRFDPAKTYTEKEVNQILKTVYDDYVTLRRYLIDYGFMDRHADGSAYWVKR